MSPKELALIEFELLAAEIRSDLAALERIVARIAVIGTREAHNPEPEEVMAIAAFLHHLYTGMETILYRIASGVDGSPPTGDRWHQALLTRMSVDLTGIRHRVLTDETGAELARLLRFRHFFRHAYRIDFLWTEVAPLAADAERIYRRFEQDVREALLRLGPVDP